MGTVHKFKRRPKNNGQFKGSKRPIIDWSKSSRKRKLGRSEIRLAVACVLIGAGLGVAWLAWPSDRAKAEDIMCSSPRILDGDTLDCASERIRLHGIDAPELEGHCRPGRKCTPGDPIASTSNLERLTSGAELKCRKIDTDVYGRTVARCTANGLDLSCAQISGGFAVRRYGMIWCGF